MSLNESSIDATAAGETALDLSTSQDLDSGSEAGIRLRGIWLLLARVIWFATMALAVIFLIAAIPVRYDQLLHFQAIYVLNSTTGEGDITRAAVESGLQQLDISAGVYAALDIVFELLMALGFLVVGAIIFWRKSSDFMAIAVSFALITFGPALTSASFALVAVQPEWRPAYNILNLGWTAFGLAFLALFPDGQFVPRWMRIWALGWAAFTVPWAIIPIDSPYHPENWPFEILGLIGVGMGATGVYAQVYRYRKVSGPARRQQTKWVVYGLVLAFIGIIGTFLPYVILQGSGETDPTKMLYDLITMPFTNLLILCLPLSVGISVLRYRLYDIDLIINRTLVYVPLTAILAGLYSASIATLQKIFVATTGEESDAAIVLTTLLLTTTFTPIKNRLQSAVDKRFKEAHDATKKLRALDEQVKSVEEVIDPTQLSVRLLDDAIQAFGATSGAVQLAQGGAMQVVYASDNWTGDAKLSVSLESDGEQIGLLQLGARSDGREYGSEDQELLQGVVDRIARMVRLAGKR